MPFLGVCVPWRNAVRKKKYTLFSISQGRRAILGSQDSFSEAIFSIEDLEGKTNGINTSLSEHTLYFMVFYSAHYIDAIKDSFEFKTNSSHKYNNYY